MIVPDTPSSTTDVAVTVTLPACAVVGIVNTPSLTVTPVSPASILHVTFALSPLRVSLSPSLTLPVTVAVKLTVLSTVSGRFTTTSVGTVAATATLSTSTSSSGSGASTFAVASDSTEPEVLQTAWHLRLGERRPRIVHEII